ncbi:MAG TPA: hypothetical protein DD456_13815 [Stenotrophomonas sp.]|jgi:2-polyprenyl-3-methyl-5-hydroxy-6-metoxy-1,4-benzoquinol methylase|nr:hypothetical protein [Stenotrophomonas sp.]
MPVTVPDDWPEWPQEDLEYLGCCPVCDGVERSLLHEDLIDRWFHAAGRWTMHSCLGCGTGYIDPRPGQASIGRAYTNYETHRPNSSSSTGEARLATRLRNGYLNVKYGYRMEPAARWGYWAMHLLPPPLRLEWDHYARHLVRPAPGRDRLLDVGCGNGEFLARARWQGWDVHGLDFDEAALAHARKADIPVTQGAVERERFAADSFDAITSHQVIEHVHDPMAFLRALHAWLKPGGRVWLGTPNIASGLHREFGPDWYNLHPPQHLVMFSPEALLSAMASVGFLRAKLLPRGYLDSHFRRQSVQMRDTADIGDWECFNGGRIPASPLMEQLKLETRAWLKPGQASDLVVVAWKPE